jgi:hypothetical protein
VVATAHNADYAAGLWLQNGAERGWVLKGVEEINLLLEDMGLNLQSMMASPHVRPFAEEVRNWEQRLSLIGEAIEVCCCRSTPSMLVDFGPSGLCCWMQPVQRSSCVTFYIDVEHSNWLQCLDAALPGSMSPSPCPRLVLLCCMAAGVDAGAAQMDVP